MEPDLKQLAGIAEYNYQISVVVRAFIKQNQDIDEFQALQPVALMLHNGIDKLYAEFIEAGLYN